MDKIAGEFNEGKKGVGVDNGSGTQNQTVSQQDENAAHSSSQANLSFTSGKATEDVMKEFYKAFVPGGEDQVNQQLTKAGTDLKKQWKVADRLANIVLNPKDTSKMSNEQKKDYKENLEIKLRLYDGIRQFSFGTINPYTLGTKLLLYRLTKLRGNIQNNHDRYSAELKGAVPKTKDFELYAKLLEVLPDSFKQNSDHTNLTDYLKENGCIASGGLRAQKRELSNKGRALADYDDLVEVFITQIGKNLETAKLDIQRIDSELAKKPGDIIFMREKTAKTACYNKLENDFEYAQDHKEDISDKLMKVGTDLQINRRKTAKKSTILLQTRECLNRLDAVIAQVKDYIDSGKDVVVMSDHLLSIDSAYALVNQAGIFGAFGDKIAAIQLDTLAARGTQGANLTDSSTDDWVARENSIRAKQRERVTAYKAQLRPSLYNS